MASKHSRPPEKDCQHVIAEKAEENLDFKDGIFNRALKIAVKLTGDEVAIMFHEGSDEFKSGHIIRT
jgi:hypothetical protein